MGARIVSTTPDGDERVILELQYTENGKDIGDTSTEDRKKISFLKTEVDTDDKATLVLTNFSEARKSVKAASPDSDLSHLENLAVQ